MCITHLITNVYFIQIAENDILGILVKAVYPEFNTYLSSVFDFVVSGCW